MGEMLLENQEIPLLKTFFSQLIEFIQVLKRAVSTFSESKFDCSYIKGF